MKDQEHIGQVTFGEFENFEIGGDNIPNMKEIIGKRHRKKILRTLPVGERVTIIEIGKSTNPLFDDLRQAVKVEDNSHFMTIRLIKSGKIVTRPYNQLTCDAIRVVEKFRNGGQ